MEEDRSSERSTLYGRVAVLLVGTGAILTSTFSTSSCQFFTYRSLDGEPWEGLTPPFEDLPNASVGLFRYSEFTTSIENEDCSSYEDWSDVGQSTFFLFAQRSGIVAPTVASLAMIQLLLEFSLCRFKYGYAIFRLFLLAAGMFQGCTFLVFLDVQYCLDAASQNQCRLKSGGWYALGSSITYFLLAVISTHMGPFMEAKRVNRGPFVMTRDIHRLGNKPHLVDSNVDKIGNDEATTNSRARPMAAGIEACLTGERSTVGGSNDDSSDDDSSEEDEESVESASTSDSYSKRGRSYDDGALTQIGSIAAGLFTRNETGVTGLDSTHSGIWNNVGSQDETAPVDHVNEKEKVTRSLSFVGRNFSWIY